MAEQQTLEQFYETAMKEKQWGMISYDNHNKTIVVTESEEKAFVANCAMYFFNNRDMFFNLVSMMDKIKEELDKKESQNQENGGAN